MSRKERDKGARREREIASLLPGAQKVSRAWAEGPDLSWLNRDVEVKARKDGWKLVYRWLEGAKILVTKADRRPWLVMMEVDELLDIIEEAFHSGAVSYHVNADDPDWLWAKEKMEKEIRDRGD